MSSVVLTQALWAPIDWFGRLAGGYLRLLDRVGEVRSLVQRYDELSDMSEEELAALGLKPDQVAQEVFGHRR
jgi:hypothetical protein